MCVCVCVCVCVCERAIGLMVTEFVNAPEVRGSILCLVIPKIQKMILDASLLNTQHYKLRVKGNNSNLEKVVTPSPTPWGSSY